MGSLVTPPPQPPPPPPPRVLFEEQDSTSKMSQDYNHHHHHHNQSIFTFANDFDRSAAPPPPQQHVAQQIRREKLRVPGYEHPPPLVPIDHESESGNLQQYDTGVGMLSEMFNFSSSVSNPTELLEHTVPPAFHRPSTGGSDWYGNHRQGMGQLGDPKNHHHHHQIDSAAAMQLFLMNPQPPPRSPSPSSSSHTHNHSHNQPSSTLHMLLPTPTSNSNLQGAFGQFTWPPPNSTEIGTGAVIEGQGLSLSLSSLQHLEAAKAEEFRMGDNGTGMMFYNNQGLYNQYRNYGGGGGVGVGQSQGQQQVHVGYGSNSLGVVNVLRNSKYVKAAQELLVEFCSVGRGQFKKNKFARVGTTNPNTTQTSNGAGGGGGGGSSSSKDPNPPLSAADRIEHQRRKVKLLSMLDEVDRRYNHYCEQMQMVVNSFDLVMGFGSAIPYTALAQKAMSRHFRCLKDAISAQLKHSCELLGEKDVGTSGVTKGETPRLKLLEQSLRQQRAFHQMGMMEQEAWRPQRGLPERSVNILRAWLFEHFLHPYPSDADKHLLARQTGLSRNQVSNWFINARVRLWKPMVEEMYQKESKENTIEEEEEEEDDDQETRKDNINPPLSTTQTPTLSSSTPTSTKSTTANIIRSHINYPENDTSLLPINTHCFSSKHGSHSAYTATMPPVSPPYDAEFCRRSIGNHDSYGTTGNADVVGPTLISFGTTTGDVSLTLGLRHAGNLPENGNFSVREFGEC